jgi:hypothetical protein
MSIVVPVTTRIGVPKCAAMATVLATDAFALPGGGTTVAAVIVAGPVGIVVGCGGRTGQIGLAVQDHGCSRK